MTRHGARSTWRGAPDKGSVVKRELRPERPGRPDEGAAPTREDYPTAIFSAQIR